MLLFIFGNHNASTMCILYYTTFQFILFILYFFVCMKINVSLFKHSNSIKVQTICYFSHKTPLSEITSLIQKQNRHLTLKQTVGPQTKHTYTMGNHTWARQEKAYTNTIHSTTKQLSHLD